MTDSRLLHNMSAPPRAVIQHRAAALSGRTLLFALPRELRNAGLVAILRRISGRRRSHAEAEVELRSLLNEHAERLPFSPAVLVVDSSNAAEKVDDLLTVCTVLAKSSGRVYLRDKEPNLMRLQEERRVILQFPEAPEGTV